MLLCFFFFLALPKTVYNQYTKSEDESFFPTETDCFSLGVDFISRKKKNYVNSYPSICAYVIQNSKEVLKHRSVQIDNCM